MSDRVFIDTNVLIYAYSNDDPIKKAKALAVCAVEDSWLSTQVLSEFTNILRRKLLISWPDILLAIGELINNFPVHANDSQTIKQAIQLAAQYQFSWYDSLIVSAALECGATTLYSEDLNNGQLIDRKLTIVNPFA